MKYVNTILKSDVKTHECYETKEMQKQNLRYIPDIKQK